MIPKPVIEKRRVKKQDIGNTFKMKRQQLKTILYMCMSVQLSNSLKRHVLGPTICNSMDWVPPVSSVHGILQARIL